MLEDRTKDVRSSFVCFWKRGESFFIYIFVRKEYNGCIKDPHHCEQSEDGSYYYLDTLDECIGEVHRMAVLETNQGGDLLTNTGSK